MKVLFFLDELRKKMLFYCFLLAGIVVIAILLLVFSVIFIFDDCDEKAKARYRLWKEKEGKL